MKKRKQETINLPHLNKTYSKLFTECQFASEYKELDGIQYRLGHDHTTLYIYCKGTDVKTDDKRYFWPLSTDFSQTFFMNTYKHIFAHRVIHYSKNYYTQFKVTRDIITEAVFDEKQNSYGQFRYVWKKIILVGYSNGAALAAMLFERIHFLRPDLIPDKTLICLCFDTPRFMKHCKKHKGEWTGCYFFRHGKDVVTSYPLRIFGYSFPSPLITLTPNRHVSKAKAHNAKEILQTLEEYDTILAEKDKKD